MPISSPLVIQRPAGIQRWLLTGGTFACRIVQFCGLISNLALNKPIVSMATIPDAKGYWKMASDGGICSYGDPKSFGPAGSLTLDKPIYGSVGS